MKPSKRLSALTGVRNERAPDWLKCLQCKYALKGLALDGVCPECGSPVIRSVPGGLLKSLSHEELCRVRSRLGLWSLALILMLAVWPSVHLACPSLSRISDGWHAAYCGVLAGTAVFAALAWRPLMALRGRAASAAVRVSGLLAPVFLWVSAVAMTLGAAAIAGNRGYASWGGDDRWVWTWLVLMTVHTTALAGFFVTGARYSLAHTHAQWDDRRAHRWTAMLGCAGALASAFSEALRAPGVSPLLWRLGVTPEWIKGSEYALFAGGGVLVGVACLLWAGAWSRIDHCAVEYISEIDAERLRQQLSGVA